jgi:hypothetical protein
VGFVFAGTNPDPPASTLNISDCKISVSCTGEFLAVGRVSMEGHFTNDLNYTNAPYFLCCKNLINMGSGVVSFKFAPWFPPSVNGSGMVSFNSTTSNFAGVINLGFPRSCFLKSSCSLASGEICVFKVKNDSSSSVASSHIVDCNTANLPFDNSFSTELCCEFDEICDDGIDNDGDSYIDCADQDCKKTDMSVPPAFCGGSPFTSSSCVVSYSVLPNGTVSVVYNSSCQGQAPITSGRPPYYYCSYGVSEEVGSNPGLCCQAGTYAKQNPGTGVWSCIGSDVCGVSPGFACLFDFDLNTSQWKASVFVPSNPNWCVSRFPYFYTPDSIDYPRMSTGCCLIVNHGEVGYFTHPDNVKIFGFEPVCGDAVISQGEECDPALTITNTSCSDFIGCSGGYIVSGELSCHYNSCLIDEGDCYCSPPYAGGEAYN